MDKAHYRRRDRITLSGALISGEWGGRPGELPSEFNGFSQFHNHAQ